MERPLKKIKDYILVGILKKKTCIGDGKLYLRGGKRKQKDGSFGLITIQLLSVGLEIAKKNFGGENKNKKDTKNKTQRKKENNLLKWLDIRHVTRNFSGQGR